MWQYQNSMDPAAMQAASSTYNSQPFSSTQMYSGYAYSNPQAPQQQQQQIGTAVSHDQYPSLSQPAAPMGSQGPMASRTFADPTAVPAMQSAGGYGAQTPYFASGTPGMNMGTGGMYTSAPSAAVPQMHQGYGMPSPAPAAQPQAASFFYGQANGMPGAPLQPQPGSFFNPGLQPQHASFMQHHPYHPMQGMPMMQGMHPPGESQAKNANEVVVFFEAMENVPKAQGDWGSSEYIVQAWIDPEDEKNPKYKIGPVVGKSVGDEKSDCAWLGGYSLRVNHRGMARWLHLKILCQDLMFNDMIGRISVELTDPNISKILAYPIRSVAGRQRVPSLCLSPSSEAWRRKSPAKRRGRDLG